MSSASGHLMGILRGVTRKVVCIGKNYQEHITELAHLNPKVWDSSKEKDPVVFLKPTTSFAFPGEALVLPNNVKGEVHHEVELGIIIGERAKNIEEMNDTEVLRRYVGGYFCGIDMTARDEQSEAKAAGLPWTRSKGYDTFLPISSPFAASELDRPEDWEHFALWLDVNGDRRQSCHAGVMLHSVPSLLRYCSSIMTLESGDVIMTGTPSGVGPVFPGDVIEAGIEGFCDMEVHVVSHTEEAEQQK